MSLNENKKLERTVILVNGGKIAGSPCVLNLGKCPVIRYSIVNGYKYDAGSDGNGGMRIGFRVAQNYNTTELSKTLKHICIECNIDKKEKGGKMTDDEYILAEIRPYIVDKLDVEPADVTLDADFEKDLHADSLDRVEMFMKLEQECGFVIPNGDEAKIQTVGDVVKAMQEMGVEPETFQKKQDVKPVQKAAIQKPSAKEITVTLTNVPNGKEKPTVLNCGTITDAQKQDFLAAISEHKPSDGDNHTCGFNVYHAKQSAMRVVPYEVSTNFQPTKQKIGKNELIVEMIPLSKKECGSWANYHCPICLASGDCTSPFIKKYIGEVLFPDKYGKQR